MATKAMKWKRLLLGVTATVVLGAIRAQAASETSLSIDSDLRKCLWDQMKAEDLAARKNPEDFLIRYAPNEDPSSQKLNHCPTDKSRRLYTQEQLTRQIIDLRADRFIDECRKLYNLPAEDGGLSKQLAVLTIVTYVRIVFKQECSLGGALEQSQRQTGGGCSVAGFNDR